MGTRKIKNKKQTRRKRNPKKLRRKRSTKKAGFLSSLKRKIPSIKGEFTNFFDQIPSYNKKILFNRLLELSLNDNEEELKKLDTQTTRYIGDLAEGEQGEGKKEFERNHRLELFINENKLSTKDISDLKRKCFKNKENKNVTILTEKIPEKDKEDTDIKWHKQEYLEYSYGEGENTELKVENKEQYQTSKPLEKAPRFRVTDNEEAIKNIVENDSEEGKNRDTDGVRNNFPEVDSFYIPIVRSNESKFKNLLDILKRGASKTKEIAINTKNNLANKLKPSDTTNNSEKNTTNNSEKNNTNNSEENTTNNSEENTTNNSEKNTTSPPPSNNK